MGDLLDLARQAMEKAKLFGEGFGQDLGTQLGQTPEKLGHLLDPPTSPLPQADAGMKLLGLLPQFEQSVSSGLGQAGVAGGKEAGLYLPNTPLGEISLGPREGIGMIAGMALPTGKVSKAAQIESKAARALEGVLGKMGPGAQRLAAQSAERKAAGAAEELGTKLVNGDKAPVRPVQEPSPAAKAPSSTSLEEQAWADTAAGSEQQQIIQPRLGNLNAGMNKTEVEASNLADEARRAGPEQPDFFTAYDAESGPARPFEGQFRLGQNMPRPGTITPPDVAETLVTDAQSPGELVNRLYGRDLRAAEEAAATRPQRPRISDARAALAREQYESGHAKVPVYIGDEGPDVPSGFAKPALPELADPNGSIGKPILESSTKERSSPFREILTPQEGLGPTRFSKGADEAGLAQWEQDIGEPRRGSRKATMTTDEQGNPKPSMEAEREMRMVADRAEQFYQDMLREAGGDKMKSSAVKQYMNNRIYSTEPRQINGVKQYVKDETGKPVRDANGLLIPDNPYPPLWQRIQDQIHGNEARNIPQNPRGWFTKGKVKRQPDTSVEGWHETPEGRAYLESEALATIVGRNGNYEGMLPDEWAEKRMRDSASTMANAAHYENPLAVTRRDIGKPTTKDYLGENAAEGLMDEEDLTRSVRSSTEPHLSQEEMLNAGLRPNVDPFQKVENIREVDKTSRASGGGTGKIVFEDPKVEEEFNKLEYRWNQAKRNLENMSGFTDAELKSKGNLTRDQWKARRAELQDEIDQHNEKLSEMAGVSDYDAWKRGELDAGDRPMFESDEEAWLMDRRMGKSPEMRDKENAIARRLDKGERPDAKFGWTEGDRKIAQRLLDEEAFIARRKTGEKRSQTGVGPQRSKWGDDNNPETNAAVGAEREARPQKPGGEGYKGQDEKAATRMLGDRLAEIMDSVAEVRSARPVGGEARKTWENYMEARLREILEGTRQPPTGSAFPPVGRR